MLDPTGNPRVSVTKFVPVARAAVVPWIRARYANSRIRKKFGKKHYVGNVVDTWGHPRTGQVLFRIEYSDGDKEDIGWAELERLLVRPLDSDGAADGHPTSSLAPKRSAASVQDRRTSS